MYCGTLICNPGDRQLEPLFTIRASKQTSGLSLIKLIFISTLYFTFIVKHFKVL